MATTFSVASAQTTTYQAESYSSQSGCTVATNYSGYTGTGFLDGGNGTWGQWTISAPTAGTYTLTFRYANGGTANRSAAVTLNGTSIGTVAFAPTGSWSTWGTATLTTALTAGTYTLRVTANTSAGGPNLDKIDVTTTADTQPPTAPTNLTATAVSSSQINLAWTASTDNVGVTGYQVFRGSTQIATTTTTSYSNTGLAASTTYSYTVKAFDAANNISGSSNTATATTQPNAGYTLETGGTASANAFYDSNNQPQYAFDGSITNQLGWGNTGSLPSWLEYDYPTAKVITRYRMYVASNQLGGWGLEDYNPKTWQFQGSNGTTWVTLQSVPDGALTMNQWAQFDVPNTTAYTKYRIYITASENDTYTHITEMELYSGGGGTGDPLITLVTTPAPLGSGNLSDLLGIDSHYRDNDALLDKAKAAGFMWIRTSVDWDTIDQGGGSYNFSAWDYLFNSLTARGMKPLFVFMYGNTRYGGNDMSVRGGTQLAAWGNFVEATTRRYAGRGARYEVWNEPDGDTFWLPSPNVSEYVAFLKASLPRVRAGDPTALVTTGGLGMFDRNYFGPMLAQGGATGYDAVGVHTYWMSGDPETVFDEVAWWRSVKNQYSLGSLQDWMTEFGYGLNNDVGGGYIGANETTKYAAWTARTILADWIAGFKMIMLYDADDGSGGQGIFNDSNVRGYNAIKTLSAMAKGHIFTHYAAPSDASQLYAVRLEGPSDITYAVWLRQGSKTLQVPQGTVAKDMEGNSINVTSSVTIDGANGPVYLTIPK